ncbi:penicillin-binding transpeptidase domain-containing protein [Salinibacter ruber]|uniref:penicillin-binding transpeptidase domain-containing protein n=1 Tax=Salinibacter ruber TaxID=146919 RepID=UPI0021D40274|nr:penicillin-binding transpeptidase domain-containing protein [Salinibacter ruber]
MEHAGFLPPDERKRLAAVPIDVQDPDLVVRAPHLTRWVLRHRRPESRALAEIRTTIDPALQKTVANLVEAHVQTFRQETLTNAAAVVLDNRSGAIQAYVGSADFWDKRHGGRNDGVRMLRQPGSALKPFTYAHALASRRYTPASVLADIELNVPEASGAFTPENYDETYHGPTPLRQALASSFNVPAVRLAREFGAAALLETLHRFGFDSLDRAPSYYGVGLTLGNGEVQPIELARAYAGLARGGPLEFSFPVAVKTGTSKDYRDSWTVGYTPRHTVAVWAGNFDGAPMDRMSGIAGAAPLFHSIMRTLGSGGDFERPPGLTPARVCPASGKRPGAHCPAPHREFFLSGTVPTDTCTVHRVVAIDQRTGRRAAPGTASRHVQQKRYAVYPERYHAWMREHDLPLPPTAPRTASPTPTAAAGSLQVTDRLRIRDPADGALFYVDPVLRDRYQRLSLKGMAPDAFRDVHWVVDGTRHASGAGRAMWQLRPGTHRIELRAWHEGQAVRSPAVQIRVVAATSPPNRSTVSEK